MRFSLLFLLACVPAGAEPSIIDGFAARAREAYRKSVVEGCTDTSGSPSRFAPATRAEMFLSSMARAILKANRVELPRFWGVRVAEGKGFDMEADDDGRTLRILVRPGSVGLAPSDDALAFALAHELAHLKLRDGPGLAALCKEWGMIPGYGGLRYARERREAELAADRLGLLWAVRAGYARQGAEEFLRAGYGRANPVQLGLSGLNPLADHPAEAERLAALQAVPDVSVTAPGPRFLRNIRAELGLPRLAEPAR